MKRKMYSFFTFLLVFLVTSCFFVGCQKETGDTKASVVQTTDNMIVIQVSEVEGEATLLSVMEMLQESEKIDFVISGGMVTEINGKANTADFSSCWMLYTSDKELSNVEWGTVSYEGKSYGSAIVGAETLTVMPGEYYIWSYQSF